MKGLISHASLFCLIVIHYEEGDKANREKTDHGSSESSNLVFCLALELDSIVRSCKFSNAMLHIHGYLDTYRAAYSAPSVYTRKGVYRHTCAKLSHTNQ